MRVIKWVPLHTIIMDHTPFDTKVLRFADDMRLGGQGQFPPAKVQPNGSGSYYIKDGRHRVVASRLCGYPNIKVRFSDEPRRTGYRPKRRPTAMEHPPIKGNHKVRSTGLDEQTLKGDPR